MRHPSSGIGSCRCRGRRHGSDERTEFGNERNGRKEPLPEEVCWGLCPQTPGIYRLMPSQFRNYALGLGFRTPAWSGPESALSLLPSSGLSSAPVVRSVSVTAVVDNSRTKKELDFRSAFRHGGLTGPSNVLVRRFSNLIPLLLPPFFFMGSTAAG